MPQGLIEAARPYLRTSVRTTHYFQWSATAATLKLAGETALVELTGLASPLQQVYAAGHLAIILRNVTNIDTLRKSNEIAMVTSRSLSEVLDHAERVGTLNLRTEDIAAALPHVGPQALRQALHRQQRRGRIIRLSRGTGHWLIVPLQFAAAGAPPLETWLDPYLSKTLRTPYYVALLSAAEIYGASPQAVMVTQVMVPKPRRPITVGRHRVAFYTRARIERMPTRWHETPDGRFKLSTPELTALELVDRQARLGGMERVKEVLRILWDACTENGMTEALNATRGVPTAQRLGALLAMDGRAALAKRIARWLQNEQPRIIALESDQVQNDAAPFDAVFKVRLPAHSRSSHT